MSDEIKVDDPVEDALESLLEDVPQDDKKAMRKVIGMSMQMAKVTSPHSELMSKVTSENISEIMDLRGKELDLSYKESHESKILYAGVFVGVIVTIFGIIFLLKEQPELLKDVLVPLITLIVGSVGGYGVGYGRSKKEE